MDDTIAEEKGEISDEEKEVLKKEIQKSKSLNLPISKIKSILSGENPVEELRKENLKREELNEEIKEAEKQKLPRSTIDEALESENPKEKLQSKVENKLVSNLIKKAKDVNVPVSDIKEALTSNNPSKKLKDMIVSKDLDSASLKDLVQVSVDKGIPTSKIKDIVKGISPKEKLKEEIKKKDLDKKTESELIDICKRSNVPIDDIENALSSENPVEELKTLLKDQNTLEDKTPKELKDIAINKGVSESKLSEAGNDKDKIIELIDDKIKEEHPSDDKLRDDLNKVSVNKIKQIAKMNKIDPSDIDKIDKIKDDKTDTTEKVTNKVKDIVFEEPKEDDNLSEEEKGQISSLKQKLKNKMITDDEIKEAVTSSNPEESISKLEGKKDIDEIINEEKNELPQKDKVSLKKEIQKSKILNLPESKIRSVLKMENPLKKLKRENDKKENEKKVTEQIKEKNKTIINSEQIERDNDHKESLINLILNQRKKIKPHKYVSKPLYNNKNEIVQYTFYPRQSELSDDYKSEDILYLESELSSLLDQIKDKESKIDKLSRDKLLYNKTKNDILDFAKEKIYKDLEYQKRQLYKLKKEKHARENMIKLMKIYMNEQQRRNKEILKESEEYMKITKEKELEKIRKIHKDMKALLTDNKMKKLEEDSKKRESEMKEKLKAYQKEIDYYRDMNEKLLKVKPQKRTLNKEIVRKEKRTHKKKKERKEKRTHKKKKGEKDNRSHKKGRKDNRSHKKGRKDKRSHKKDKRKK